MNNPQRHPDQDTLTEFGLGRLDPPEASWIEEHLSECKECCDTLLNLKDDTFAGMVRTLSKDEGLSVNEVASEPPAETAEQTDVDTAGSPRPADDSVHAATMLVQSGDAVESSELPDELKNHPRYRIVERIGSGGMGDVFRGEHRLMNRSVALKLINSQLIRHPQAVERFRREVQAAAQLAHPNIVAAYDAEQAGDVHFLAMEFVEGTDLSDVIERRGPLPVAEACDYIRQAALGLQHAHEKGMVHRDIKPHNLMLSPDGQVRILDFGLAGFATESAIIEADATSGEPGDTTPLHLTTMGSVMGTPDYIAPEQARDAHSADIRADIYSLGCTLYCLLTGGPPHQSDSVVEKLKAHAEREPEAIEAVRVDVPEELAEVIRRMMSKDPAKRFQTPAEVADALAPFVDQHRTDGGGTDAVRRGGDQAAPQNPLPITFALCFVGTLSILASVFAVVLFLATEWTTAISAPLLSWLKFGGLASLPIGATALFLADRSERRNSHAAAVKAGLLNLLPVNPCVVVLLPLTIWTLLRLRNPAAQEMYATCPSLDREEVKRRWPLVITTVACLLIAIYGGMAIYVVTDYGKVRILVKDPDAKVALRCDDGHRLIKLDDYDLTIGVRSGENTLHIEHGDLSFETDEFTVRRGQEVIVEVSRVQGKLEVRAGDVVIGQKHLASQFASPDDASRTLREIRRFGDTHTHRVRDVALVPSDSGTVIATSSFDGSVRLWDTADGQQTLALLDHDRIASAVAASPDGNTLATTDGSGNVRLWDRETGQQKLIVPDHKGWMFDLAFSPAGQKLFVPIAKYGDGKVSGKVLVYDVATGDLIRELSEIRQGIHAVVPVNENQVLVAGEYHLAGIWDVQTGEPIRRFEGLHQHAYAIALSPDAKRVATGHPVDKLREGKLDDSETAVICLWDVATGKLIRKLRGHTGSVNGLAWSLDGRFVISGSGGRSHGSSYTRAWDNSLRVWDAESGKEVARATLDSTINSLVILPDGMHVVTGGGDDEADVRLWQLPEVVWPNTPIVAPQSLTLERTLAGRTGSSVSGSPIAASADGRWLISADGTDKQARLWDVATDEAVFTMPMDTDLPESVAISGDGTWAAVRGLEGHIDLWNLTERKRSHQLDQTENRGSAMTFSADGRFLVTGALKNGSSKGQAIAWDVESGQRRHTETLTDGSIAYCTAIPGTSDVVLSERKFWRWNLESGAITALPGFPETMELGIDVSSDGSQAVVVGVEKTGLKPISGRYSVEVRNLNTGKLISCLETGESTANSPGAFNWPTNVCFFDNDQFVAAGYLGGGVRVWNIHSGRQVAFYNDTGVLSHAVSLGHAKLAVFTAKEPDAAGRHDIEILRLPEGTSRTVSPQPDTGILTRPPSVPKGGLPTGKNLIDDPSLEGTKTGQLPKGWSAWLDDGPDFKCEAVEGGVTGKHCLRISGTGKRGVVFCTNIPMDRTKRYALKGHVKVEGDASTWAVIKLNYFNRTGWLGVDDRVGVKSGESGWKLLEKTDRANAFPEATLIVPTCHIEGNGTAWFDDLEVIAFDRNNLPEDFDKKQGKNNRMYSLD